MERWANSDDLFTGEGAPQLITACTGKHAGSLAGTFAVFALGSRLSPGENASGSDPGSFAMTMRRQISTVTLPSVSKLRRDLGMTRSQFARLVQASERSITKWEGGDQPGPPHANLLNQLQRIYETASRVMKPTYVGTWLESPLEALGGLNPREAMERGEYDRVWRLLFAVESGGYS